MLVGVRLERRHGEDAPAADELFARLGPHDVRVDGRQLLAGGQAERAARGGGGEEDARGRLGVHRALRA